MNILSWSRAAALACTAGFALQGHAMADTLTVPGEQLVLTSTLSSATAITVNPSLSRTVRLSAPGPLGCLSIVGGQTAVIGTGGCEDLDGLEVDIPPTMPVTITGNGTGTVKIGYLQAPLVVNLTDSFDVQAVHVGSLVVSSHSRGDTVVGGVDGSAAIEMTGHGDVRLARLHGPLSLTRHGPGDVDIGEIAASGVSIESSGSGDTLIGGGTIDSLHVNLSGSGDLGVAARVGTGDITASGGSDVKLGLVTGALQRSASGGSTISVGGSPIVTDIMAGVAQKLGQAGDLGHNRVITLRRQPGIGHFITVALVGVTLFFIWRIVRRAGGLAALRRPGRAPDAAAAHPGVVAVAETMTRLEQRLGRIEEYVTTREFDLNRKFRELGPH